MKATEHTLGKLLRSGDQYVVPVFQRYYTWDVEDWDQLWSDLEGLLDPEYLDKHHFLGAIVCVPERHLAGMVPAYQIIDGQQRLTTLSLLLCAIRDTAFDFGFERLGEEIDKSYLIQEFKEGRERYRVFPRARDRDTYQSIVDRRTASLSPSQLLNAYKYFLEQLHEIGSEGEHSLRSFLNTIIDRLDFVAITLEGENAYKIFKSLNSTGQDLGQQDLIRNHVFMGLPFAVQEQFDGREWRPLEEYFERDGRLDGKALAEFFRDVFMRNGSYVREDDVAHRFETEWPTGTSNATSNAYTRVREYRSLLRLYEIIEGRTPHPNPSVQQALESLRSFEASTAYPLVLRLMEMEQGREITTQQLGYAINCIAGFILRRYVCSESSRSYGKWFCAACKDVNEHGIEGLLKALHFRGWPNDDQFQEAFYRFPLYDNRNFRRVVLVGLESALQSPSERVALDQCSIEHVMPQSIEDDLDGRAWQAELGPEWQRVYETLLHTPGNLTLVGANYNREMQKKPFAVKKPILSASRVYLNRYFADSELYAWNEAAILQRGRELAHLACQVWIFAPQ